MHPRWQGKVPEDGTDRCLRYDTPAFVPPLCCCFVQGCANVGQGVHLGGENLHFCEEDVDIQVVDHRVPLGVRVQYDYGLHLCIK